MSKRQFVLILVIATCLLSLSGCADPNPLKGSHDGAGDQPGFWWGLWNGFTFLFSLIGSIFGDFNVYEVHNKGWFYNLGFFLGFIFFLAVLGSDADGDDGDEKNEKTPDPDTSKGLTPPVPKPSPRRTVLRFRIGGRFRGRTPVRRRVRSCRHD